MKLFKWALAVVSALSLVGCGGGGCDAGASSFTGTPACGSTTPVATTATNLVLQLDRLSINNSGGETVTATATATAAGGQTVAGVPVTFSVDSNALFTPKSTTTDANGVLPATVSIGSDHSNRIVTVTAVSGALSATASFAVKGASLAATPVPAIVTPSSTGNKINFVLTDANAAAMAGQSITVTGAGLPATIGTTDANGSFVFTYTAPAAAGNFDVTGTAGGDTKVVTVISNSSVIPDVVTPILSASVAANPSVVATNSDTTINRSEIRALFLGANNQPIKNVRVRFDLNGDVNSIGGTFSTGSSVVYSDANGIASTAYIPADRSSPTNGVTIRACYDSVDFAVCNPNKTALTTLTVISDALAVTIGSNEKVYTGVQDLTYIRKFVVLVVDASGRAKANVEIVPSVDLPLFAKGYYVHPGAWTNIETDLAGNVIRQPAVCANEDQNRNGVLEANDDLDKDNVLEPRKSDVSISMIGGITKTDASGLAYVQIEYPKNVATWVQAKILISASGISGTEGRAIWTEILPAPAEAFTATTFPAFGDSPYGLVTSNAPSVTYSDGSTAVNVAPCMNPN